MKPAGFSFEEIRPQQLIVCDLDGKKIEGRYERHSEVFIHTELYKARPDVQCVVHTHAAYATAFGSLRQPIRPISHEGSIFAGKLPLFEYTTALIRTPELGQVLAKTVGEARGALMRNHGLVMVGTSVQEATIFAALLEKACRVQLLATASGEPSWSSDEEAKLKFEQIYTPKLIDSTWAYFIRSLGKTPRS
jgi:L-fuculose-phosphate aldolase